MPYRVTRPPLPRSPSMKYEPVPERTGTCKRCGDKTRYVSLGSRGAVWVHASSGDFLSDKEGRHDCNTYNAPDPRD